jgi:L-alanine-DL-glutamate epimerase-like enolase superfamily enzyme
MSTQTALPESDKNRIKIVALKAMEIQGAGQTLVKVETDAGIFGIGEAGAPGPVVRGQLRVLERLLLGEDPLAIDRLFNTMVSQMHTYRAHLPTVSGVDIALWDIAGKVMNRPICELLAGKYRDSVTIYYSPLDIPADPDDRAAFHDWAQKLKENPEGYKTFKCGGAHMSWLSGRARFEGKAAVMSNTLTQAELDIIRRGNETIRDALGFGVDIIVHDHGQWDLPSAIGLSQAVESIKPIWIEDALPVWYSDQWLKFKQASRVPVATGEKLEHVREFLPFIVNGALDALHPDLCWGGGITGCRRIAELAELYYLPVALHNVGSMVQQFATAHFGAMVRNFVMAETRIYARPEIREMCADEVKIVGGQLAVPKGPGLGLTLIPEVLKKYLLPGEPYWA